MIKRLFSNNVNSILATISLHLMVVIAFLWFKLGEARPEQKEQVLIEFNEEITPPEDQSKPDEESAAENGAADQGMPNLSSREVHSIASNTASKLDKEISTQQYEQEVMKELGISSLKSAPVETSQPPSDDENAIGKVSGETNRPEEPYVPNVIRKDNTTVSYFLENRWHSYIYIPTYRCQGGGTVIIDIVINQTGKVISAVIAQNKSTRDECLLQEAYRSASSARFNADQNAPAKQVGTITYVFLAQ
jgi:TonB family protein